MKHGLAPTSAVSLALRVALSSLAVWAFTACASDGGEGTASGGGGSAAGSGAVGSGAAGSGVAASGASGAITSSGAGGALANAGAPAAGGSSVSTGGAAAAGGSAGAPGGAGGASAGAPGSAGTSAVAGAGGSVSNMAGASGGGASGGPPSNCGLPSPVSFQKNIQGFLTTSCGKNAGGGCHVTDTNKTSLGYDHAYDWITAVAHTSSCGKTMPYAKRFEVVLAVINGANPASCPNSRKMPPAGSAGPQLTTCQVAALTAWLAEPMVSQMHVPETDDTMNMYPAGPYLMPPFN